MFIFRCLLLSEHKNMWIKENGRWVKASSSLPEIPKAQLVKSLRAPEEERHNEEPVLFAHTCVPPQLSLVTYEKICLNKTSPAQAMPEGSSDSVGTTPHHSPESAFFEKTPPLTLRRAAPLTVRKLTPTNDLEALRADLNREFDELLQEANEVANLGFPRCFDAESQEMLENTLFMNDTPVDYARNLSTIRQLREGFSRIKTPYSLRMGINREENDDEGVDSVEALPGLSRACSAALMAVALPSDESSDKPAVVVPRAYKGPGFRSPTAEELDAYHKMIAEFSAHIPFNGSAKPEVDKRKSCTIA